MEENSLGVHGRAGQFTVDFKKGLVDIEGQIADMAVGCGLFSIAGAWYSHPLLPGGKCQGRKGVSDFFRANPDKMATFMEEIYAQDKAGILVSNPVNEIIKN